MPCNAIVTIINVFAKRQLDRFLFAGIEGLSFLIVPNSSVGFSSVKTSPNGVAAVAAAVAAVAVFILEDVLQMA